MKKYTMKAALVKRSLLMKALACGFAISVLFSAVSFETQCKAISKEVFRLHILANSDSDEDQALKLKVRDRILEETGELFVGAETKDDVMHISKKEIARITEIANEVISENGYYYQVQASVVNMPFNTREYETFTLPAGNYDALRIIIGEGEGQNWWCVMFPPMCISAATKSEDSDEEDAGMKNEVENAEEILDENQMEIIENKDKYEYKFKLVEIYESITNYFSNSH